MGPGPEALLRGGRPRQGSPVCVAAAFPAVCDTAPLKAGRETGSAVRCEAGRWSAPTRDALPDAPCPPRPARHVLIRSVPGSIGASSARSTGGAAVAGAALLDPSGTPMGRGRGGRRASPGPRACREQRVQRGQCRKGAGARAAAPLARNELARKLVAPGPRPGTEPAAAPQLGAFGAGAQGLRTRIPRWPERGHGSWRPCPLGSRVSGEGLCLQPATSFLASRSYRPVGDSRARTAPRGTRIRPGTRT